MTVGDATDAIVPKTPKAEREEDKIWMSCVHEAGHAAVATWLGFYVKGIKIGFPRSTTIFKQDHWSRSHPQSATTTEETRKRLVLRMSLAIAGLVAEEVFGLPKRDLPKNPESDLDDVAKLRASAAHWFGEPAARELHDEAWARTRTSVAADRDKIERLAEELVRYEKLSGHQVREILGEANRSRIRRLPRGATGRRNYHRWPSAGAQTQALRRVIPR